MENSLKGLMLAAGTIITCVVISLGFFISRQAKSTAATGTNQIGKLNNEFAESDKMIYDGCDISGTEVISVLKKFKGSDTNICVETPKIVEFYGNVFDVHSGELYGDSRADYDLFTQNDSDYYINPYATFNGKVVRDINNVIVGIFFLQNS